MAYTVFVLGHRGMLGRTVTQYLRKAGCEVLTTSQRYEGEASASLVREVADSACSVVINCVGTTVSRCPNFSQLLATNSLLPQHLAVALGRERLLVHASSDAVFDGRRGNYRVDELPNADDAYGLSKRLGELCASLGRVIILRTSIIGREHRPGRGLLEWFLNDRTPIPGFDDQRWNGITALTWARLALQAIQEPAAFVPGIHQPACAAPVTKRELLEAIRTVSGHTRPIIGGNSGHPLDRTLVPTILCPPIIDQLSELFAWEPLTGA